MVLDEKDLLQVNATVIAGVLILLTFAISFNTLGNEDQGGNESGALAGFGIFLNKMIIAAGIIPFIVSEIILLTKEGTEQVRYLYARRMTIYGLSYLAGSVFIILLLLP